MTKTVDTKALSQLGLAGKYDGIEVRVKEIPVSLPDSTTKHKGRFFYLTFRDGQPTLEEFIDFIYFKMVSFCIPRAKREEKFAQYQSTGDDRYAFELLDQARNLFVKSINTLQRSGEPGELILYILLEAILEAPQIACKMFLKTSENMNVHGSDSVHLWFDEPTGEMTVIWGESKLRQQLSTSLDDICKSIHSFHVSSKGRAPRKRDLDIIQDHANISDKMQKDAFIDFFNPYSENSNKWGEVTCCLSGFTYSVYDKIVDMSSEEAEDFFKGEYVKRIESAYKLFQEKVKETNLEHLNFIFILLPFPDLKEFRRGFFQKLGMSDNDIQEAFKKDGEES